MGQPAARITDMHMCPMITPGTPPIPHVGGPIIGPGVPNVLIGKMPAVVMGDMCTCVGPPDSIIKGSMGVMIGGRPAARMGDLTVHGGSIVFGFPTVLIGEVGVPSAVNLAVSPVMVMVNPVVIPPIVFQNMPPEAADTVNQTTDMQNAAAAGSPTVDACPTSGGDTGSGETPAMPPEEEDNEMKIQDSYFTDIDGNRVESVGPGDTVYFVIESQNLSGESVKIDLNGNGMHYEYEGSVLEEDILEITLGGDTEQIELKVIAEIEEETPPDEPDNPKNPRVKKSFFTDSAGNIIEEIPSGENFYLVLQTQKLIGETVDIQFDQKGMDYEYQGNVLTNDTISITVEKDNQVIELKAVEVEEVS